MKKPANADALGKKLLSACKTTFYKGKAAQLRHLAQRGANVEVRDPYGRTPLILMAKDKHWDGMQALLEAGADVNLCSEDGFSALSWCAMDGNAEMCQALLDRGAAHDFPTKLSPLQLAAQAGHAQCCRLFLQRGVDPDTQARSAQGQVQPTALSWAARKVGVSPDAFLTLLEFGADPRKAVGQGLSAAAQRALEWPLHFCASRGATQACLRLVESGWDLDQRNGSKLTAAQGAIAAGHHETAEALCACKARREASVAVFMVARSGL